MAMARPLDDKVLISGQILPQEVAAFADDGVRMIINNRPDGEEAGQPLSAEIEAAAEAAGMAFRFIPIMRGIGPSDVEAMREALQSCDDGWVLAYCRSGTRSALAWAVVRREDGVEVEELVRCASDAGVDISPVAHLL
jgi:uncharacterized protein (TIGR01244 family)